MVAQSTAEYIIILATISSFLLFSGLFRFRVADAVNRAFVMAVYRMLAP